MRTGFKIGIVIFLVLVVIGVGVISLVVGGLLWWRHENSAHIEASGIHLIYQIETDPAGGQISSAVLDEVIGIERRRFSEAGTAIIKTIGTDRIEVIVPRPSMATGPFDPTAIDRLVTGKGLLEFRTAVSYGVETPENIAAARSSLSEHGSSASAGTSMRWFAIYASGGDNFSSAFVKDISAGENYVLLYDDATRTMLHGPSGGSWKVDEVKLMIDPRLGGPVLFFKLDPAGATLFGTLTTANQKRPLTILMDDRAISAPTIQTPILGGQCQISFGEPTLTHTRAAIQKEAEELQRILNAGVLPGVRLRRVP